MLCNSMSSSVYLSASPPNTRRCARQEGDEEYDPAAADDEFAGANGAGPLQEAAEEEEETEFDEAAIADEERNERKLMAGAPVPCHTA